MTLVTTYGPTLRMPRSLSVSVASTWLASDGATGTHDQAGAWIGDVRVGQPGLGDGLLHGDVVVSGTCTHEAADFAIDPVLPVDVDQTGDGGPHPVFGILGLRHDAGLPCFECFEHLGFVVADTRNHTQPRNHYSAHQLRSSRKSGVKYTGERRYGGNLPRKHVLSRLRARFRPRCETAAGTVCGSSQFFRCSSNFRARRPTRTIHLDDSGKRRRITL